MPAVKMPPDFSNLRRKLVRVGGCLALLACCLPVHGHAGWERVEVERYTVDSPFWSPRIRHLIVDYVPFIMDMIENDRSDWKIFARYRAVAVRRSGKDAPNPCVHNWAETTLLNTFESMCWALTVDPQGDPEMLAAQKKIREGIDRWIPVILGAQEQDGYLCTDAQMRGFPRFFSPPTKAAGGGTNNPRMPDEDMHEGYMMGYFIECAIAHHRATGGSDLRLYHAAKKGADLFYDTIGEVPKLVWQPDHAGLEQSLARFALLVDEVEGAGAGDKYVRLAKWLLENRGVTPPHTDGYRQKDRPLARQQEPYGHAVMFGYLFSGAADVARLSGDLQLQQASDRLWTALVGTKMYLTGTMGSKNEEFRKSYDLPNDSLLGESCAAIANLYFQQNLNLLHGDAKYADVAEVTLYNGLLGAMALDKPDWQYFNQLDQSKPGKPVGRQCVKPDCCMGNISRTLLRLPSWIYSKSPDGLTINQFVGGTTRLRGIAGTDVTVVQNADYPWDGRVSVSLHPEHPRRFAVRIRAPGRQFSPLYTPLPQVGGIGAISVNGSPIEPVMSNGYAVLDRKWADGDRIDFRVPLEVQRVHADERVAADHGRVALQYGPMVYNFESVDLPEGKTLDDVRLAPDAPLSAEWDGSLLGGVKVIRGAFADGTPLLAVPHYARMNRAAKSASDPLRSTVWVRELGTGRTGEIPPGKNASR
jgi:DUF1680 family protein